MRECAVWDVEGAIAVWDVGGSAIAVWGVRESDRCLGRWRVWGVRECDRSYSVFSVTLWFVKKDILGKESDSCGAVCDSEALLQAVRSS